jgi:hypothetical protein
MKNFNLSRWALDTELGRYSALVSRSPAYAACVGCERIPFTIKTMVVSAVCAPRSRP